MSLVHRSPRHLLAAFLFVLALGIAACGDTEPTSTATPAEQPPPSPTDMYPELAPPAPAEPLGKEDYVAALDAAHMRFSAKAEALDLAWLQSPAEYQSILREVIPALDQMRYEVDALQPPAEVAAQHRSFATIGRVYSTALRESRSDLASSDNQEAEAAARRVLRASGEFSEETGEILTSINLRLFGKDRP